MYTVAEKVGNLVQVANDDGISIAHCINADFAMGAGIADQLNMEFGIRAELEEMIDPAVRRIGNVVVLKRQLANGAIVSIFNLITKATARDRPTYEDFTLAVTRLRDSCLHQRVTSLGIPRMGCGIDRLEWPRVRSILESTFAESGISLTVYQLAR